jgi:hypothetical protein
LTLPYVYQAATVTPAALLPGVPRKQHHKGAVGGLLRQIGDFGIISLKDFGSVLSMRAFPRKRAAALRTEVPRPLAIKNLAQRSEDFGLGVRAPPSSSKTEILNSISTLPNRATPDRRARD